MGTVAVTKSDGDIPLAASSPQHGVHEDSTELARTAVVYPAPNRRVLPLITLAQQGKVKEIEVQLSLGANPDQSGLGNGRGWDGRTPLYVPRGHQLVPTFLLWD
jgi:hypothetical protein